MLRWIPERYGAEVATLTLDLGQGGIEEARQKALQLGAVEAFVIDARQEFAEHFIAKAIQANGLYQDAYPLSTALARPLMAESAVEYACRCGADAIAHGCTGKGNDQVRFEVSISALAPGLKVLAPVREWSLSREQELQYAAKRGIPVGPQSKYSIDENLWGRSIECGELEDPAREPPAEAFAYTVPPERAPDEPDSLEIEFEAGIPIALDGKPLPLAELIEVLNERAGRHGVGIIDMTEDRVVGLKSREVYECPAAVTLLAAHRDLERFCCTIHENELKPLLDRKWAELVYQGLWHDPLREALDAFIAKVNEKVTGTVRMKLYKGQARVVGRSSPYALYAPELATYEEGSLFDQGASVGFIQLWGLPTRLAWARRLGVRTGEGQLQQQQQPRAQGSRGSR
jgi:argininosuccinate synthase